MTMFFNSPGAFAAHLLTVKADVKIASEVAIVKGCQMIQKEAKREIGHYQDAVGPYAAWAPLAESTKSDRVRQGFPPDEPLLRTGSLKGSIEWSAPHREGPTTVVGFVGSNHPHAAHQELGTTKIPPRSFIAGAAARKEDDVHKMAGRLMFGALAHGGEGYHELRALLHLLHATYETAKELVIPEEEHEQRR